MWLDEIEADFQALRDEGLLDEDDDSVRMARVIRELAKLARAYLLFTYGPNYIGDLSDDAKELLIVDKDWLSDIYVGLCDVGNYNGLEEDARRMVRVIRELRYFIRMNIDFDSPLRPVGLGELSDDTKDIIGISVASNDSAE